MEVLKYYLKPLVSSLLLFLSVLFFLRWCLDAEGEHLIHWQVLNDEGRIFQTESVSVPFDVILPKPTTVVLKTQITRSDKVRYLYLPQIVGSFFAVYADERLIASVGFSEDRTAHLWYKPFLVEVPPGTERITIELSGVHEIGLDIVPTLIESREKIKFYALNFLCDTLVKITIGLCLTLAIVLYLVSRSMPENKQRSHLMFSVATLLGGVWLFDLISFHTMYGTSAMLLLRKIFVSSAYLGFALMFAAIALGFFEKVSILDRVMILINLSVVVLLWSSPSNYLFKVMTSKVAFVLLINAVYIVYKIFRTYSKVLLGFSFFFVLCVIFDALTLMLNTDFKFLSNLGIVSLFLGFSYNLVIEYREMMVKATVSHMKSLIDPLTGAYNRGVLVERAFNEKDVFVYLDLNSFKEINDNYGHEVGDRILVQLVNAIRSRVKTDDLIVRMGGDEFLVVLRDCDQAVAKKLFDEILKEFENSHPLRPTFSYGIKQFEGSLQETLRAVDDQMYKMKETMKKRSKE